MSVFRAAVAGSLLALSCMEAPPERRAPRVERSEPAAVAIPRRPSPTVPVRREPPPMPAEEPIDPRLVPVEEDFRTEVERRIDRRSDLELELQRVERELRERE